MLLLNLCEVVGVVGGLQDVGRAAAVQIDEVQDVGDDIDGDETAAVDVITDILHFVNLNGGSPAYVLESAYYTHYLAEVEEEHQ